MQSCGGCTANDVSLAVQVLMNPATWVVVGAALTTYLIPKSRKSTKDKK